MTKVYLYEPRGAAPEFVYKNFQQALDELLEDEGYHSSDTLESELRAWGVECEIDLEAGRVYIDDGAKITPLELK